jgi:uncharacterized protein YdhG (YjbR/CyaY superfamily)
MVFWWLMKHVFDAYLSRFEGVRLQKLREMQHILETALPEADACISYGMPAFRMTRVLVYFAGNAHHVGFYPTSSGIRAFKQDLSPWKYSKGAIQFPYDKALPKSLIKRIAIMRRNEVDGLVRKKCDLKTNPRASTTYKAEIQKLEPALRDAGLAKPALRALIDHNIRTIRALRKVDESVLLSMHGIGPSAMRIIKNLLHSRN